MPVIDTITPQLKTLKWRSTHTRIVATQNTHFHLRFQHKLTRERSVPIGINPPLVIFQPTEALLGIQIAVILIVEQRIRRRKLRSNGERRPFFGEQRIVDGSPNQRKAHTVVVVIALRHHNPVIGTKKARHPVIQTKRLYIDTPAQDEVVIRPTKTRTQAHRTLQDAKILVGITVSIAESEAVGETRHRKRSRLAASQPWLRERHVVGLEKIAVGLSAKTHPLPVALREWMPGFLIKNVAQTKIIE